MKTGILLINLGTPVAPTTTAVRRYLHEFLSDPRVIDIPAPIRYALLYGLILPFRSPRSARAYQAIWQKEGSPLLIHSQALTQQVQQRLGQEYSVKLAMRYGKPSIETALDELIKEQCEKITVFPLFPHYAAASGGSAVAKVLQCAQEKWNLPPLDIRGDFFDNPKFIRSLSEVIQPKWQNASPEVTLFSFHGLPSRHLDKSGCTSSICSRKTKCPAVSSQNRYCYRAQCFATARLLAKTLSIGEDKYRVCFQSRLGRTPWIGPDIDEILVDLAQKGVKRLAVVCPSFVADCLETLEEIGIRAKARWQELGASQLSLLPCLNAHPSWVNTLVEMIRQE